MENLMKRCKNMKRKFSRTRMFHGLGLALLLGVLVACVEKEVVVVEVPKKAEMRKKAAPPPRCLQLLKTGRKIVTEAWAVPDNKFNFGEPLTIQMRVSSPTYMSVFHVSTSCKVTRLLDNKPVKAAEIVDFPSRDSGMKVIVKPPAGREAFYLIATREKLEFLANADFLNSGGGGIARLYLTPEQFYQRVKQFRDRINPDDLSIRSLPILIIGNWVNTRRTGEVGNGRTGSRVITWREISFHSNQDGGKGQ